MNWCLYVNWCFPIISIQKLSKWRISRRFYLNIIKVHLSTVLFNKMNFFSVYLSCIFRCWSIAPKDARFADQRKTEASSGDARRRRIYGNRHEQLTCYKKDLWTRRRGGFYASAADTRLCFAIYYINFTNKPTPKNYGSNKSRIWFMKAQELLQ